MENSKIQQIIKDIFNHAKCSISKIEISEEDGMVWFMIETPDSRFMIGRDGETLRSLNHLVRKMAEKGKEQEISNVFIDINGYQKKRFDSLKTIAHMMAERAKYFKSNIEIDPMPANERRIIHMFLENVPEIKTESEGYGANRRVVIKYIGKETI